MYFHKNTSFLSTYFHLILLFNALVTSNVIIFLSTSLYPPILNPHHFLFFFFNDTATTEIYTLSLHDALPILLTYIQPISYVKLVFTKREILKWTWTFFADLGSDSPIKCPYFQRHRKISRFVRSEEHTSELQSLTNLVCRLLLEKKKKVMKLDISNRGRNALHLPVVSVVVGWMLVVEREDLTSRALFWSDCLLRVRSCYFVVAVS